MEGNRYILIYVITLLPRRRSFFVRFSKNATTHFANTKISTVTANRFHLPGNFSVDNGEGSGEFPKREIVVSFDRFYNPSIFPSLSFRRIIRYFAEK